MKGFLSEKHKTYYAQLMKLDGLDVNSGDQERKALFFIIAGNQELYMHRNDIYNFETHGLKGNVVSKLGYMCKSAISLLRLGMHLYSGRGTKDLNPCAIFSNLDSSNRALALNAIEIRFE